MIKNLFKKTWRYLKSEDGPTTVEYAILLALLVIICLTSITAMGTNCRSVFTTIANSLAN